MARYLLTILVALAALIIADPLKLSPITDTDFSPAVVRTDSLRYDVASLDRGNRLSFSQRLLEGKLRGPESLAFDPQARVFAPPLWVLNVATCFDQSYVLQTFL